MSQPSTYEVLPARLEGEVTVSGAKNSALRLLVASLLTSEPFRLLNYPDSLLDAQVQVDMLRAVGKSCEVASGEILITEPEPLSSDLVWPGRSIRNTLLVLGALTARTGRASVPAPGGCDIGDRKWDLHEVLLARLGARVWEEDGQLNAEAETGLVGAEVRLPIRSTGVTENALLCGALAKGTTKLYNPHLTPEVFDLIAVLREMGARVDVFGQESIEVTGRDVMHGGSHRVMPDRIEAITWVIAAAVTSGDIEIHDFPLDDLAVPLAHLRESGCRLYLGDGSVIVRRSRCSSINIGTGSHPAVHSDMQPLFAVYAARGDGESEIIDLRYPGRFAYVDGLRSLGVDCEVIGNGLRIRGGRPFGHAELTAPDLRAGAALLVAALAGDGPSTIKDAWQIERGYANICEKLKALGATVDAR